MTTATQAATTATERRQFSDEFKREAVRLAKERGNLAQVARELGISDTVLQRWKKALDQTPANPFPARATPRTLKPPRCGAKTPGGVRRTKS